MISSNFVSFFNPFRKILKFERRQQKNHAQTTIPVFLARPTRFINRSKSESPFSVQLIIRRLRLYAISMYILINPKKQMGEGFKSLTFAAEIQPVTKALIFGDTLQN